MFFFYYLLSWRGSKHLYVHLWRIGPIYFLSEDENGAAPVGGSQWQGVYLPLEPAFSFSKTYN